MLAPEVRREGDKWTFRFVEQRLGVSAEFIKEDDTGFWVELHVVSLLGKELAHEWRGRLNLISDTKARVADRLAKELPSLEWSTALEALAERVVTDYRAGEPLIKLSELAKPDGPRYLVDPILRDGEPTVIFAPGGTTKSLFALGLAVCVTTGRPLPCGLTARRTGAVMYLDWETTEAEEYERVEGICAGLGVPIPGILYRRCFRSLADEIRRVREDVDRNQCVLVVIDSMAPACAGEPESAERAIGFFNAMRSLGSGVAKLVIAHTSKSNAEKKEGQGSVFGSVFAENLARSVWEMRRAEGEGPVVDVGLFHRKTNRGPRSVPLGFRATFAADGAIRFSPYDPANDPSLIGYAALPVRIRFLLRESARTIEDLAVELEVGESGVASALRRMPDASRLNPSAGGRGNRGLWGLRNSERPERAPASNGAAPGAN